MMHVLCRVFLLLHVISHVGLIKCKNGFGHVKAGHVTGNAGNVAHAESDFPGARMGETTINVYQSDKDLTMALVPTPISLGTRY